MVWSVIWSWPSFFKKSVLFWLLETKKRENFNAHLNHRNKNFRKVLLFLSCKFQQNIFIFVSVSLIFCSKKISYQTFAPPASFLNKWTSLQKSSPLFVRTTLNSMQNLSSLVLNFFMRNFYWNSCTLKNFRRLYQICIQFVHRVLFLYMKLHCTKLYF